MKGQLYIISAPSGAGKSSLLKALFALPELKDTVSFSVSHTTRLPRTGEQHGKDYFFVTRAEFQAMIAEQQFLEYAEVFNNFYGTSFQTISSLLDQGIDVFLDIDWQGAYQVKEKIPQALSIFVVPPNLETLEQRLVNRATDSAEIIAGRLAQANSDITQAINFDYVIVNDDFNLATANLKSIITSNRLRVVQTKDQVIKLISCFK